MNFADHYLSQTLHYVSLAKGETTDLAHVDMLGKAMDIIRQVINDRSKK